VSVLGDISSALQGAVDWTFSDAVLKSADAVTVTATGGTTRASVDNDCRAKVDRKWHTLPDGSTVLKTRILILVGSLAVAPAINNAVVLDGETYRLGPCARDGLNSHWVCEVVGG
jgi:hypothetical protein